MAVTRGISKLLACCMVLLVIGGCSSRKKPDLGPGAFAQRVIGNGIEPRFSGDGSKVIYTEYLSGRSFLTDVFLQDVKTGARERVTNNSWPDGQPDLSPDGNQIVFVSRADGEEEQIWMFSRTRKEIYAVTDRGGSHPDWHPSLPAVLYSSQRTSLEGGPKSLYVTDLQTGKVRTLVSDLSNNYFGRWSPDGRLVAFVSDRSGNDEIYITEPRTRKIWKITDLPSNERFPCWTADMNALIFSSDYPIAGQSTVEAAKNVNLWWMDIRDLDKPGAPELLFQSTLGGSQTLHPDFSPNGKDLIFSTNGSGMGWEVILVDFPKLLKANREGAEWEREEALKARKKALRTGKK